VPSIQLFHPVFGHFLDNLLNTSPMPPEITKATVGYMQASSAIYNYEANHRTALDPHLGCILSSGMGTVVNADGTSLDGALSITLTKGTCETVVTLLKEEKNNLGDGGCDPLTQVGLLMTQFWAQDQVDKCNFSLLTSALMPFLPALSCVQSHMLPNIPPCSCWPLVHYPQHRLHGQMDHPAPHRFHLGWSGCCTK
jgi:hypothetical protein